MGKINLANIKKTIYYLKRNGIVNTWYAAKERLERQEKVPYTYRPVSEEELAAQRKWSAEQRLVFSIVVPTYRTNELYLREMIQSVKDQSYPHWELVLADATDDDSVGRVVEQILAEDAVYADRIRYVKLSENAGIAANTNQALLHASGDYVGLLDHDDVLTPDALYEMAVPITEAGQKGITLQMLYSDEDKCNGDRTLYYERNRKEVFNPDLLFSNNYICHFLVMKSDLIKSLGFRPAYDGAQDYDLVLRAGARLCLEGRGADKDSRGDADKVSSCGADGQELIAYVPKVLYHWRCHTGSTAENPQSKQYAYDAGLRALQDLSDRLGYQAKAVHLKHLGFYTLDYPEGILKSRPDLGAVGGRILGHRVQEQVGSGYVTVGGRMDPEGYVYYEGILPQYSGYMHRAVLTQNADAVDIRCMQVRRECRELFEKVTGVPYRETSITDQSGARLSVFDAATLPAGTDYKAISIKVCKALQEAGYHILYYPSWTIKWKEERQ